MIKIIDTHAHYEDAAFDEDRDEMLMSLQPNGVYRTVNIGCTIESSRQSVELSRKYDFIYAVIGVHPTEIEELSSENLRELYRMAEDKKVIGIGEIGLDYHYEGYSKEKQFKGFAEQIELARDASVPLIIHSREAAEDTFDILKEHNAEDIGGVMHCYSYSKEMAKRYVDMGFFIGVGGVVTFKNGRRLKETVEYIPLENIVLETDSPYMAPEPFRGRRNSSINIPYMAAEIARLKNISIDEVYEVTFANAKRLYRCDFGLEI